MKRMKLRYTLSCMALLVHLLGITQNNAATWEPASFSIAESNCKTFTTTLYAHIFSDSKHNIVKISKELKGLTGIKRPMELQSPINVTFDEPVELLVGVFKDKFSVVSAFKNAKLVLENGLTVTGLPPVNVYAVPYSKGKHSLTSSGIYSILGVIKPHQELGYRNAGFPDGTLWNPTFIVEGFSDEAPLFEILEGLHQPVIDEGMPGTEGIQGGFEGGRVVKINDTYHMFPTERAGEVGVEDYYDRVKTRIGHWTSKDFIHWKRESTLYQSSGTYALTEEDNPMNDRRAAIWSYMPIFSKKANKWYGYYLAYTVHKEIEPNHSFGRIWRCESVVDGIEGIGGPYKDVGIIIEPGLDAEPWEGRQGVASFFPYKVDENKWLGFYSGAYPFKTWDDYPKKTAKGWFVALAASKNLEGPWNRLDRSKNPITSIHPFFVENPIVSQLPDGTFIAVFDGGPEGWGHHLPNMIAYTLSKDGIHWSEARYLPIETKVSKWWDIMRTPLCLIPEGNDIYTIFYAAIDLEKRFHPIGMIQVKLNRSVLAERVQKLIK